MLISIKTKITILSIVLVVFLVVGVALKWWMYCIRLRLQWIVP